MRERKVHSDISEVKAVQWDWHRNLSARGGQCICWPTSCGLPFFFFLCWLVFTFIQLEKKVSEIPRNFREFIESNNAFHRLCFINNFLRGGHFNRLHKWSGVHSRGLKFGPIAEANHNAKSTLGCDPVGILGPKSLRFDFDHVDKTWSGLRVEWWSWRKWKVLHAHQELWLQVSISFSSFLQWFGDNWNSFLVNSSHSNPNKPTVSPPFTPSTCYSDGGVGGYGMSWFDAMECCYYNKVAFLSHLNITGQYSGK